MTTLGSRVAKVERVLTARERALALYIAACDGREPDPELRRTMPAEQNQEFSQYADLMRGVFSVIAPVAESVWHRADAIQVRWWLFRVMCLWAGDLEEMKDCLLPDEVDPDVETADAGADAVVGSKGRGRRRFRGVSGWRRQAVESAVRNGPHFPLWLFDLKERGTAPVGDPTASKMDQTVEGLWRRVPAEAQSCYGDMLAAEANLAEVHEALGCPGASNTVLQPWLGAARSALESVRDEIRVWDKGFELPGANEETLELISEAVRRC